MEKSIKLLFVAIIALSLSGCGDDNKDNDNTVDPGAIANSVCKTMVQCEGKLGKLPSTLTAADIQNQIDTCNNMIITKFFKSGSDSEAADYIKCLEGLECNALDSVYASQAQTVPQTCQSQFVAFASKGSSNLPSEQCANNDADCICKKNPSLPACQASSNPPADQCNDNDVECICKKNPNLAACQGTTPPSDQCSDDDLACQCKKNPNLPACQETPPPSDQCSDDDVECICKKNPNLPACQETPPPSDQCSDDDIACWCKKNPNLPACQSSTPVFECKDDKDQSLSCICKKKPELACGSDNPPQYDISKIDPRCKNNYMDNWEDPNYFGCLLSEAIEIGYRYCADRVGTDTHCGIRYSTKDECMRKIDPDYPTESSGSDCHKGYGDYNKGPSWHYLCREALIKYAKCMTSVPCSELQKGADDYENCMKSADPKKVDKYCAPGDEPCCSAETCRWGCTGSCDVCVCGETVACEKKKNPCKNEEDDVRYRCSHCPSMGWK